MCVPKSSLLSSFSSFDLSSDLGCIRIIPSATGPEDDPRSLCSEELLLVLVLVLLREPVLTVLMERDRGARGETWVCTCWIRLKWRCSDKPWGLSFLGWVARRGVDLTPCRGATVGPSVYSFVLRMALIWSKDKTWTCCARTSLRSGSPCGLPLSRRACSKACDPLPCWALVSISARKRAHPSRLRTHLKSVIAALHQTPLSLVFSSSCGLQINPALKQKKFFSKLCFSPTCKLE